MPAIGVKVNGQLREVCSGGLDRPPSGQELVIVDGSRSKVKDTLGNTYSPDDLTPVDCDDCSHPCNIKELMKTVEDSIPPDFVNPNSRRIRRERKKALRKP